MPPAFSTLFTSTSADEDWNANDEMWTPHPLVQEGVFGEAGEETGDCPLSFHPPDAHPRTRTNEPNTTATLREIVRTDALIEWRASYLSYLLFAITQILRHAVPVGLVSVLCYAVGSFVGVYFEPTTCYGHS